MLACRHAPKEAPFVRSIRGNLSSREHSIHSGASEYRVSIRLYVYTHMVILSLALSLTPSPLSLPST